MVQGTVRQRWLRRQRCKKAVQVVLVPLLSLYPFTDAVTVAAVDTACGSHITFNHALLRQPRLESNRCVTLLQPRPTTKPPPNPRHAADVTLFTTRYCRLSQPCCQPALGRECEVAPEKARQIGEGEYTSGGQREGHFHMRETVWGEATCNPRVLGVLHRGDDEGGKGWSRMRI